jgi:hypothetical protein
VSAVWVFDDVRHDIEAVSVEERAVLFSIQASVVKWFAFVSADRLAV